MTTMIRALSVTKRFGATIALEGIDLDVARGECLGLAGPHGAGRTTLLRVLAALTPPTAGSVVIDGVDAVRRPLDARSHVAYVGEPLPPGSGLLVREHLACVLGSRPARTAQTVSSTVDEILERARLAGDVPVDALSEGLRQRLALAASLALAPPVLLLDDPLQSLDASARAIFVTWLTEVRDRGTAIILSLTDDEPVTSVCHQVARLEKGRLASRVRASEPAPIESRLTAAEAGDA